MDQYSQDAHYARWQEKLREGMNILVGRELARSPQSESRTHTVRLIEYVMRNCSADFVPAKPVFGAGQKITEAEIEKVMQALGRDSELTGYFTRKARMPRQEDIASRISAMLF